jgi:anti-sigma regulatory factor (Ser/Thr protein kinase)
MMSVMMVRHEVTGASAVRRELALDLDLHGLDEDTIDAVTLVASELVGNAVRHAGIAADGELDIAWTIGPHDVMISVEDPSPLLPVRRNAAPDAPNGRGLAIVDALTSAWGVEPTKRGKRVWAKVRSGR